MDKSSLIDEKFQESLLLLSKSITIKNANQQLVDTFFSFIEKHWINLVPKIYVPKSAALNQTFDDEQAFHQLMEPLEWFITGQSQARDVLNKLKDICKPPQLCGRVFKQSEPNYNCRDCSNDSTCVLCVDCFKNSVHRKHRYRIGHSSCGYCDCGDPEAWKSDAICSLHAQKANQIECFESALAGLMSESQFSDMVHRLGIVFSYVLDYIYLMLKWNEPYLPERLRPHDQNEYNDFACLLYNDETHTYEHVIMTLVMSIKCNNKLASEYATTVDREGRSIIFYGSNEKCKHVEKQIEQIARKHSEKLLQVKVLNVTAVAHQTFAIRLMSWIMDWLPICIQFRQAFANILYKTNHQLARFSFNETMPSDLSFVEKIMRSDTCFWKSIRVQWHQLFMSGLLLDIEIKKHFARLFTRNYFHLLNDFIQDDHDFRVSVLSLGVQFYTVPSIASMLIGEEDAFAILLNSFLQINFAYHKTGRFKFESSSNTAPFKRSYCSLSDLQHLLTKASNMEPQWNDKMRENFINGAESFIKLLKRMQNIDSITRQLQQHIEYEPSWDTGINFEIKISPLTKMLIEWSISDRQVYLSVLNIALRIQKDSFDFYANGGTKTNQDPQTNSQCKTILRHYADKSAMVCDYNVSRKEISIHIPLSRFVAGMLFHLPKFDLFEQYIDYSKTEAFTTQRLNVEQMMELALRTQVLLGQFRAGMWRRNGYSLANQIIYYQRTKMRDTTYDLDILNLQLAAAMLDANEFMIHVMYKYNIDSILSDGASQISKKNDDFTRQEITLVEEFFRLIYTILVERYTVGLGDVTMADCRKNEIIQWLCKGSMSHSELMMQLPYDEHEEPDQNIEELILDVAEFQRSNSSVNTAGRYILKEENYERFNPFYYHYSRQDQSAAFENQIKRKRSNKNRYCCCPPPPLPDWSKPYESINDILICPVTLTIIRSVLDKCINLKDIYFSEFQFQQVLYLIGIGLNEQIKHGDRFKFSERCMDYGIVSLLEQCSAKHLMQRVVMHQPLYEWCLDRFKQVLSAQPMIVEQISPATTRMDDHEQERDKRRQMAQARKDKILQQMKQQQRLFMKENEKYFKENLPSNIATSSDTSSMTDLSTAINEHMNEVAFGPNRTGPSNTLANNDQYTCILCLESQTMCSQNGRYLLLAGFIQRSTVLSTNRNIQSWTNASDLVSVFARSDHNYGPFVNTCTHYMHNDCFEKFFETTVANDRRRSAHRYPRITFDLARKEFPCPLCESLSNLTIPIIPALERPIKANTLRTQMSMNEWLIAMLNIVRSQNSIWINSVHEISNVTGFNKNFDNCIAGLSVDLQKQMIQLKDEYLNNAQDCMDDLSKKDNKALNETRHRIIEAFMTNILKVTKVEDNSDMVDDEPHDLLQCMNWSISYSIQVMERSMRLDGNSLNEMRDTRQYQCLRSLIWFIRAQLNYFSSIYPRRIFFYMMNYLLVNTVYQSSPKHLLDIDAFTVLVSLMATAPSFFTDRETISKQQTSELMFYNNLQSEQKQEKKFITPLGNTMDKNLIELMLIFHIVQIILTNPDFNDVPTNGEPMDVDNNSLSMEQDESQQIMISSFCKDILMAAGHKFDEEKLVMKANGITSFIKCKALPFLRCTALWAFFLSETQWPKHLWNASFKNDDAVNETTMQYYDQFCNYLAIDSNLGSLMQSVNLKHLCLSWTRHQKLTNLFVNNTTSDIVNMSLSSLRQPQQINQFINLPFDFSDLINSVANFTCPNSKGEESRSPTLCLICGEILCSQNYCCKRSLRKELVGACTYHSQQCSASMGIFLRIRDNKILLLTSRSRGCYLPSPYIDKYGETDSGLLRGHPMSLSSRAYNQLHRLWFRHGIAEQIVHLMETSNSLANTNWNIM